MLEALAESSQKIVANSPVKIKRDKSAPIIRSLTYREVIHLLYEVLRRIDSNHPPSLLPPDILKSVGFTDGKCRRPMVNVDSIFLQDVPVSKLMGRLDQEVFLSTLTAHLLANPGARMLPVLHPSIPLYIQQKIRETWIMLARAHCPLGPGFGDLGYNAAIP